MPILKFIHTLMAMFFSGRFCVTKFASVANLCERGALVFTTKAVKKTTWAVLMCVSVGLSAHAKPVVKPATAAKPIKIGVKSQSMNTSDLSSIRVTKYELALVQVLAEVCPQMLNARQRERFYEAYHYQLRAFIPTADNPEQILDYLSSQRDYRAVLQSVRSWTASFPVDENRELCADFADIGHAF